MWAIGKCKSNIDCYWLTHHKTSRHDPRLSEHPQVKIRHWSENQYFWHLCWCQRNHFKLCQALEEMGNWESKLSELLKYLVWLWDGQDDFKCSLVELIISRLGFHKNFEWRRKIFECGQLRAVSHIAQLCPHPPLHLSPQNFHFLFCSFFCHFHFRRISFRQISVNLLLCWTFT